MDFDGVSPNYFDGLLLSRFALTTGSLCVGKGLLFTTAYTTGHNELTCCARHYYMNLLEERRAQRQARGFVNCEHEVTSKTKTFREKHLPFI